MRARLRSWLSDPLFLLCLTAGLLAFVVQSGELGTSDTMHRLQTTHSFWTSEPQVFPNEYPEFGLHGRGGKLYSWYGMGQSLLMLPADIVGTYLQRLRVFSRYDDTDPTVRNIFVSYTTNILVNVLTALICFRLLRQLRFEVMEGAAGVLALLFCTTHLHYTQNMMENNYIMLLTLTGFSFQYDWLKNGSKRALRLGSLALGLNLLTRLTTCLDLLAAGIFLLLVLRFARAEEKHLWEQLLVYLKTALPIYTCFLLVDRAYQFYRFGSFWDTYVHYFALEFRKQDPTLPANFPWTTPFHAGFFGPLFAPEKSVFLFDPLLILAIALSVALWKRCRPEVKAYIMATLLLLLSYVCFYARYFVWSGDFAWGDRYVSTSVELVALIALPLLLQYRAEIGKAFWPVSVILIVLSAIIQFASLAFWLPLEIYQMETFGHPTFVIALRFKNIIAFAMGKMDAWGLNTHAMTEDPWDYVHITTWNFLPFVLRRVGEAPRGIVETAFAIWGMAIVALGAVLLRLGTVLKSNAAYEKHSKLR